MKTCTKRPAGRDVRPEKQVIECDAANERENDLFFGNGLQGRFAPLESGFVGGKKPMLLGLRVIEVWSAKIAQHDHT